MTATISRPPVHKLGDPLSAYELRVLRLAAEGPDPANLPE